jgi:hypothetical protein
VFVDAEVMREEELCRSCRDFKKDRGKSEVWKWKRGWILVSSRFADDNCAVMLIIRCSDPY